FMFKLLMPTPLGKTLRKIMAKTTGLLATEHGQSPAGTGISDQTRLAIRDNAPERYQEYCMAIQQRRPLPAVEAHILNILLASNQQFAELDSLSTLDRDQQRKLTQLVEPLFVYGLGPRAATALMLGAKAWSFFFSDAVHETADGSDLARVVLPALRHRLKLHFHWVETYGRKQNTNNTTDIHETALLDQLIADFCILAAPKGAGYQDAFAKTLQAVITQKYGGA
ncbi:MAG: hypothetical protein KDE58_39110, partial [Caldilineaceae bacterium]|nr:hypothetical protein [Caldilineaceae bacterium]